MMNIYSIFTLLSAFYAIVLGVFILYKSSNSKSVKIFFLLTVVIAIGALSNVHMQIADSFEEASLWSKIFSIWPLSAVLSVHFVLSFDTEKNRSLLFYLLLYFPGIMLTYIQFSTSLIILDPVYENGGWSIQYNDGWLVNLALAFGIIYWCINALIPLLYYYKFTGIAKKQVLIIFVGILLNLIITVPTEYVFPFFEIDFPQLGYAANIITLSFIAYGIWRYNIFLIDSDSLSGKLFSSISNYLILTDNKRNIIEINDSILNKLEYSREDVLGKNIKVLLDNKTKINNPLSKYLIETTEFNDKEILLKSRNGDSLLFRFSVSQIYLNNTGKHGMLFFGLDDKTKKKGNSQNKNLHTDFLAVAALDLVQLKTKNEIYNYASQKIYELYDKKAVVVCSEFYDDNSNDNKKYNWRVNSILGINTKLREIIKIVGSDISELRGQTNPEYFGFIENGKLMPLDMDYKKLTNGKISDKSVKKIINILGLNIPQIISIEYGDRSYGSITFATKKKSPTIDKHIIESFIAIVSLVLKRQYSEKELVKTAKLFQAIVENSQVSIFLVNKNKKVLLAEGRNIDKFGLMQKSIVGQSANSFLKKFPEIEEHISRALMGHAFKVVTFMKNSHYMKLMFSPFKDENGKLLGTLIMADDVTARIIVEKEMEEFNKMQTKLFSVIGHDLRSPIANILSFTKLMLTEFNSLSAEQINKYLTIIQKSAINGFDILNSLLEWSRSMQNDSSINTELVCFKGKVEIALEQVIQLANKKEIEIINEVEIIDCVMADKNMIVTVIRNLLSNAIKFTNHGGRIIINTEKHDNLVQLSITDNGIGMDGEQLDKLFEFDGEKPSRGTEGEKGSGLGLQICKDFVEKNGGILKVKSKIGIGSVFSVIFPLASKN